MSPKTVRRLQLLAFLGMAFLAIVLVSNNRHQGNRITNIERNQTFQVQCDTGNNASCQAALTRLIRSATPEQLRILGQRLVEASTPRNGSDGKDGTNGKSGSDGSNGKNGSNGKDGSPGARGSTGSTGATGASGSTGATGLRVLLGRSVLWVLWARLRRLTLISLWLKSKLVFALALSTCVRSLCAA
jgi:uncharacterized membrane protein YgcG